jgi:hypothetical protein
MKENKKEKSLDVEKNMVELEEENIVVEEKSKEEKKTEKIIPKYGIDTFIEESVNIRKNRISGAGFKVWFTVIKSRSLHEKLTMKDWDELYDRFLKSKTN